MTISYHVPNGTSESINLTLSDDSCSFKFRIPLRIPQAEWDTQKQRPKNIYLKRHKTLNNILDLIKIVVTGYIKERRLRNKTITQRGISREIQKVCREKQAAYCEDSLLFVIQSYIDGRKQIINETTYRRYQVFFNLLRRFEGYLMKHLMIQDINSDFVQDFILFGRSEEYSENTISRTINFVKTILNFVERKGIRTAVRELETGKEKQQKEMVTLTETEIFTIESTDVPKELQCAKDWLIISCYTGQRFSDFMQFSKEKLLEIEGKKCIAFVQKKTRKKITLPLHPAVVNILRSYNNEFPPHTNMKDYNIYIKQIAQLAGLNYILKAKKRTGHRVKNMLIEKSQTLSSHIGRRSFATNFYGKIPTPLLMDATGHSTEQMFLKYINPIYNERIIQLGNFFDQIYQQKKTG